MTRLKNVFVKQWFGIGVAILLVALGVYAGVRASRSGSVSQEFLSARKDAASVSTQIVELTRQTGEKIRAVNYTDLSGNTDQAIAFIGEAKALNQSAYTQTFELTRHLQRLAGSLSSMGASELRGKAYDAISVELALVSEFILYTQKLNIFLESLSRAIATGLSADRSITDEALKVANEQGNRINAINEEFLKKMEVFDSSL